MINHQDHTEIAAEIQKLTIQGFLSIASGRLAVIEDHASATNSHLIMVTVPESTDFSSAALKHGMARIAAKSCADRLDEELAGRPTACAVYVDVTPHDVVPRPGHFDVCFRLKYAFFI